MSTRLKGFAGIITMTGILAVGVIGNYEGLRLRAYQDVVGVWTACYGETKDIKQGMRFTKEQCDILFIESLQKHEATMRSCLNDPDGLPEKTYVAFLSLTYNVGGGAFCKSSVARDANNRKLAAACDDLLKFNKAGGRVVQGLVTRRNQERKLCLAGLKEPVSPPVIVAQKEPEAPVVQKEPEAPVVVQKAPEDHMPWQRWLLILIPVAVLISVAICFVSRKVRNV